jgi:hypothetical protein
MPPRPIRWKTFWLGLLVFLFLLWAWGRSVGHCDSLTYGSPGGRFMIECQNSSGSVALEIGVARTFLHRIVPAGIVLTSETRPGRRWLGDIEITRLSSGRYWIQIAHWLLIVLFLLPWLTFLAWRQRKQRRHHRLTEKESNPPPPAA